MNANIPSESLTDLSELPATRSVDGSPLGGLLLAQISPGFRRRESFGVTTRQRGGIDGRGWIWMRTPQS